MFAIITSYDFLFASPQPPPKRTESEITFTEKSLCNKVVLQFVTLKFKHVLAICSPLKSNFMSVIDIMSGDLNFFLAFNGSDKQERENVPFSPCFFLFWPPKMA